MAISNATCPLSLKIYIEIEHSTDSICMNNEYVSEVKLTMLILSD